MEIAEVPKEKWTSAHAGDDTVVMINKNYVPQYLKTLQQFVSPD